MMAKIVLKPKEQTSISDFLKSVIKLDAEARISFIINDKTCKIIMGADDSMQIISLDVEKDWLLKDGQWSLSASSFKQCLSLHLQQTNIEVDIEYTSKNPYPHVDTLTKGESRIYILAKEIVAEHLDFLMFVEQAKKHTLLTTSAIEMANIANSYTPYDSFETNKAESKIRIERDNRIIPFDVPEGFTPKFDLLLNKDGVENLKNLCESTKSETVTIYTDDERAVFSDGNNVISNSLLSLRDYANKKEINYVVEQKLVISIYTLKDEITSYRNMGIVKKANEALLYIDSNCVMLAGLTEETGGNCFLSTQHIKETSSMIYRINLSALSKVKISDITTAKQIKLQMLLDEDGKRSLGFYSDKDSVNPYQCIDDIELAPEKMNKVIEAKKALEKKLGKRGEDFSDPQLPGVGFDGV